jgi:LacI family transcriptional regulator
MRTPQTRRRATTLKDIAREAGVSLSTASRVLTRARNGEPVDTPAATRVLTAAGDLKYEPNLFAASLRTKRSRILGVLVPRLTDIVLSTIYEGIDARASEAGYQTVVANTMDDPHQQRARAEKLLQRGVDALLFGDARIENPFLDELTQRGVPFALISRRHPPYDSACCDDNAGGSLVGNHLADLGHRQIAILGGHRHASTGVDRTEGCLKTLAERGIDVPPERVMYPGFDAESGRLATCQLMAAPVKPTAIFAVNDMAAIGVMGALRDLGYTAGKDVAIVGFNDITIAVDLPIPLTSVHSPLREMGDAAAGLILDRLERSPTTPGVADSKQVRLHPRLVVRESSDPSANTRVLHSQRP